ncbi:MAG TPA: glycosyltransferase [Spirochaetia bacterium]|nr:glycosyltransferase [Spirochaetia bacterium]
MAIPRVLHQIWLQGEREVPERYDDLRRSWKERNPGWEHRFWDDASIRALVAGRYPWFLSVYDGYRYLHQRVDSGRYFILYEQGGVYADLDTECLRPMDRLLRQYPRAGLLVSEQPFGPIEMKLIRLVVGARRIVTNAVMAAAPQAPPLAETIRRLPHAVRRLGFLRELNITYSTGPALLSQALDRWSSSDPSVAVVPAACFEPHFGFDLGEHAESTEVERYVVHSQEATWHAPFLKDVFESYFKLKNLLRLADHA